MISKITVNIDNFSYVLPKKIKKIVSVHYLLGADLIEVDYSFSFNCVIVNQPGTYVINYIESNKELN